LSVFTRTRKWFQLNGQKLYYYPTNQAKEAEGVITLTETTEISIATPKQGISNNGENGERSSSLGISNRKNFRLKCGDGKVYILSAINVEELTNWTRSCYFASRSNSISSLGELDIDVEVNCMTQTGPFIWIGGMDMTLRIWDSRSRECIKRITINSLGLVKPHNCIIWRLYSFGQLIYAVVGNVIFRINCTSYEQVDYLHEHTSLINCVVQVANDIQDSLVSGDQNPNSNINDEFCSGEIWSLSNDKNICVWHPENGKLLRVQSGHTEKGLWLMNVGHTVWSISSEMNVLIWSSKTGVILRELTSKHPGLSDLLLSVWTQSLWRPLTSLIAIAR